MKIGIILKRRRENLGLTQSDVAKEALISRNHLSGIENNKVNPSLIVLEAVCQKLGMQLVIRTPKDTIQEDTNE